MEAYNNYVQFSAELNRYIEIIRICNIYMEV